VLRVKAAMPDFLNFDPVFLKNVGQIVFVYLLTAFIGWEREESETHSAGLRTFPLVGIASCGYLLILGVHPNSADQSRVLQGLIAGIGFVGGGAILKEGATVRGTATAASIWNAGVIGASVAMEHYGIAVVLSLLNLFTLHALLPIRSWIEKKRTRYASSAPQGVGDGVDGNRTAKVAKTSAATVGHSMLVEPQPHPERSGQIVETELP